VKNYILKIDCSDEIGLIYKISTVLFDSGLNIEKNDEFVDIENGRFFLRAQICGKADVKELKSKLLNVLPKDANVYLQARKKKNIVLMATKESHCLGDIILKYDSGELNANILCVISNYDLLRGLVEKFDIPYIHISSENKGRREHENEILKILKEFDLDYIVLAKYMRILTPEFVKNYEERIINIHHSFLPAFIGANPYKQAYERGVKIIGATAHIVNDNLDEGPIISQDVISVDHSYSWKDMQRAGRNVEKVVLSNALDLVLEDRIFVYANKTIVF
jgi:formyltetrahydrofolate deformylase